MLYTLVENAKAYGLNPRSYLVAVLEGLKAGKSPSDLLPQTIVIENEQAQAA